jgi:DNA/RNA-binding protein KIN17
VTNPYDESWLITGVIVKVMNKTLQGGLFYKKKGVIVKVDGLFVAHVQLFGADKLLVKLDADELETVIPARGKPVMIVNGKFKGERGCLETLDSERFCVSVRLSASSSFAGLLVTNIEFEHVCKVAPASSSSSSSSFSSSASSQ